jgi:hypothetical protein
LPPHKSGMNQGIAGQQQAGAAEKRRAQSILSPRLHKERKVQPVVKAGRERQAEKCRATRAGLLWCLTPRTGSELPHLPKVTVVGALRAAPTEFVAFWHFCDIPSSS